MIRKTALARPFRIQRRHIARQRALHASITCICRSHLPSSEGVTVVSTTKPFTTTTMAPVVTVTFVGAQPSVFNIEQPQAVFCVGSTWGVYRQFGMLGLRR